MSDSIRYIQREKIDHLKWNEAINAATNGLVYAYSWYLDQMASGWDALVMGEYEFVMPLPWRKKYGIYYLYQPAFTASLGVFGKNPSTDIIHQFIESIPTKFKLIEIDLNSGNQLTALSSSFIQRTNYTLALYKSYDQIRAAYRDNTKRNIKKAIQLNCEYRKELRIDAVIQIAREQAPGNSNTSHSDYEHFKSLFLLMQQEQNAVTRGVYSASNELLASAVFFFSHNRAYYILVGNHPNGKTLGASHYLIDRFIEEYASSDIVLDFEGSDIRNLAFFYSSFGAVSENYPALRINRLPWWVRWLKKT